MHNNSAHQVQLEAPHLHPSSVRSAPSTINIALFCQDLPSKDGGQTFHATAVRVKPLFHQADADYAPDSLQFRGQPRILCRLPLKMRQAAGHLRLQHTTCPKHDNPKARSTFSARALTAQLENR